MKKLICSACVMIMVSSTPFEVQGKTIRDVVNEDKASSPPLREVSWTEEDQSHEAKGCFSCLYECFASLFCCRRNRRPDGERMVDPENIDDTFGVDANWAYLGDHEGSHRLDDEHMDDPENIDDIFGGGANWADLEGHEWSQMIYSLHPHADEAAAAAVAVLPDDGYDSVEHGPILGGRTVWDAARAVNEAMNREDNYHEHGPILGGGAAWDAAVAINEAMNREENYRERAAFTAAAKAAAKALSEVSSTSEVRWTEWGMCASSSPFSEAFREDRGHESAVAAAKALSEVSSTEEDICASPPLLREVSWTED